MALDLIEQSERPSGGPGEASASGAGRQILAATATVTALSIVVKATTGLRELLVAWLFGTSDAVDAYLIAYAVPYFLITILGGALPAVLVPAYVRMRGSDGARSAELLLSWVVVFAVLALVPLSIVLVIGAPWFLPLIAGHFSADKLSLTVQLTAFLAPTLATSSLIAVLAAALNAHHRFVITAVSPIVTTACAVGMLLALGAPLGIHALAIGTLVGTVLETAALLLALRQAGVRLRWPFGAPTAGVRELAAPLGHILTGSVLMASTLLVDQAMAAALEPGSTAALNYAARIVMLPLSLTAAALGTVVLPHFSSMVARRAWNDIERVLGHYLRLIFAIGVPIALGLAVVAGPLVQVLLARGSFAAEAVPVVAATLAALALQIPFYTATIVLMRLAAALQLTTRMALVSAAAVALNVVLNMWLSSFLHVAGIALSTSLVYVCMCGLLLVWVRAALTRSRTLAEPSHQGS